jgi:hydrogenase expression/formation protein HypE
VVAPRLPLGKLPPELLERILKQAPLFDERLFLGPGTGLDCAVLDFGERFLVLKSDPITFASDEIGWYLVQVNTNDIATTGAIPRWLLLTALLPEGKTTPTMVEALSDQVNQACRAHQISLIGGHTEITHGLDRPLLIGTLIGEVARQDLVTPCGARPGDRLLITKGVPIEGTAILAREFPSRLASELNPAEIDAARQFLHRPGISVLQEAQIALKTGGVTAMHDPTEGGLAAALWELAKASHTSLEIDTGAVPVPELSRRVCRVFGIDPLATIASGALLLTCTPERMDSVRHAIQAAGIACAEIGVVSEGPPMVWDTSFGTRRLPLPYPARDEIARLYEQSS